MLTQKERIERAKRILLGLAADVEHVKRKLRDPGIQEDITRGGELERLARGITEYGAMLHDVVEGREHVQASGVPGTVRGARARTTTRRVRAALGYTHP